MVRHERTRVLADLRQNLARLEGTASSAQAGDVCRLGPALDEVLSAGGLRRNRLHEVTAAAHRDGPAAAGFACALLARLGAGTPGGGAVLWCALGRSAADFGRAYGPGLAALGVDPARVLHLMTGRDTDVLWAMEEGIKSGAVTAVVGEIKEIDLRASRRLALAAQESGITPLLLRTAPDGGASAAWTRWRAAAAPSSRHAFDPRAPGRPCWHIELVRSRDGGRQGFWTVEWDHETHCFHLAPPLGDGAAAAQPAPAVAVCGHAIRRSA